MIGYDMKWAAFHVLELMSSTVFKYKRIGFLAASQSFDENTEIIIMTTQLFKKTLTSSNFYEQGLALSCLSNICTPDLARDILSDVANLLSSSRFIFN
jgi:AP-3 complex subunit delta-1